MRALFGLVLALVGACYDPSAQAGAPCSANGTCPATLVCTGGYCLLPGVGADADDDGASADAPDDADAITIDAPTSMGWSPPTALVGVNTSSKESDPSFTSNRLELYFVSARAGGVGGEDIWYTSRASVTAAWAAPINVAVLNSTAVDSGVEISADGSRIYFVSTRTGASDIYTSTKAGTDWSPPTLVPELSSPATEDSLGVSPDGLTAIVSRSTVGGRTMHIATRANLTDPFGPLTAFAPINSAATDPASPSLTNGASTIYFHADTSRNIYVVTKVGVGWSSPVPVTEVNTVTRDAAPFVTQTDNYMFYEHDGQLYETHR